MQLRILGHSQLRISPLVLGTDNFANPTTHSESERIILRAIESGINLIDTSNSYAGGESERIIGKVLKESGLRESVVLASKVFYPTGPGQYDRGLSAAAVIKACEASLIRLQTDRIDLYQLHRPDFQVAQEETLEALNRLKEQGKIRFIGSSTAPAWRIREGVETSQKLGYPRFTSEQPPYNLLDRRIEQEIIPACQELGLGILCWSPLAMGMLAGRYADGKAMPGDSRAVQRKGIYAERVTSAAILAGNHFVHFARESGHDPARLAIAWVKEQAGITAAIIGPKSSEQLEHLLPVLQWKPDAEILRALDRLFPPGQAIADFHNTSGWTEKINRSGASGFPESNHI